MNTLSKVLLASAAIATISACSSEMSEDEKAILEARLAEEAKKPTNLTAVIQANPDLSTAMTMTAMSGVGEALKDEGPFTAFVATNDAFKKMGNDEISALMTPEQKDKLANILKFHLLEGSMDSAAIAKAIADGGGTASFKTIQGGSVKAMMVDDKIVLEDAAGNKINISEADVESSNGTIHIIDNVMMPG